MRAREMKDLLATLGRLTANQRDLVLSALSVDAKVGDWAQVVQFRVAGHLPSCPRCQAVHVVRNGQAHGLSVRKVAKRLGVHTSTAFRWRHRVLALPRSLRADSVGGIVEVDETYVLRSYKGQRKRLRQAQRVPGLRGGKASTRGLSHEHVPIVVVRERSAQTVDYVLDVANKFNVTELLRGKIAPDAVMGTDGSELMATVAKRLGLQHEALNLVAGKRVRGPWHIQNVNAYHARLKQWMRRFNGVATSYLSNYTGWFRALDANSKSGLKPDRQLATAVGA